MKNAITLVCWIVLCFLTTGCSDSKHGEDHDHPHGLTHESQVSFESLLKQICEHRDAIKAAFDANNQDEAHHPLHEIGHLISKLPNAAAETDLAESDWNEVKQAADKLMADFTKVDALFHNDEEGVKFAEVEQSVNDAIAVLQAKLAISANAQGE